MVAGYVRSPLHRGAAHGDAFKRGLAARAEHACAAGVEAQLRLRRRMRAYIDTCALKDVHEMADEYGGVDALSLEQVDWLYDKAYLRQYERTDVDAYLDAHEDELEQEIADLKGRQVEYAISRPVTDSGAISQTPDLCHCLFSRPTRSDHSTKCICACQ